MVRSAVAAVRASIATLARPALVALLGGLALAPDLALPALRLHPYAALFAYSAVAAFLMPPPRSRAGRVAAAALALVAALAAWRLPHVAGFWPEWAVYVGVSAALVGVAAVVAPALTGLSAALGVDNTALLLLERDGQSLVVSMAHGPEEAQVGAMRVPVGQGVAGRIAATRRPLVVRSGADLRALDPVNPYLRERVQSLAGVPLVVDARLIGVLHVDAEQPDAFTDDDVRLLQLVGNHLALALDHARLMAAEREARAEAEARRAEAEAHRAEAEARRAQAEAAVRLRDDFLAAANHDLRTPLTAIVGYSGLLEHRLAQGPLDRARLAAALRPLAAGARRMARIVDDIADAVAVQAGRPLALRREPTDLGALVAGVIAATMAAPDGADRLRLARPAAPVTVAGDRARLERVLQNIIDNALKYSEEPVAVVVSGAGAEAVVTVRDRGVGIPAADLPRIFERYYRASNAPAHAGGTGIGLATARAIVERHGGTITLESAVGQGTTVVVRLPRDDGD